MFNKKPYHIYNNESFTQYVFKFKNNYGASVIIPQKNLSLFLPFGKYEIAVIGWIKEDYNLLYNTNIAEDVISNLTIIEVNDILDMIENIESIYE